MRSRYQCPRSGKTGQLPIKWITAAAIGVLVLVLVVAAAGCTSEAPEVALFYYNGEDPYIHTFVEQIKERAAGRLALTGYDARNSQTLQNEQIDGALADAPDLLIVNPVDRLGAYTIVNRARKEGVPVIFFNREPLSEDLELWSQTYYVGARAEQSARFQARLIIDLFGGDPAKLNAYDTDGDGAIQTIILKGEQGHQDAEIRTAEVLRAFETAQFELDILAIEVSNWDRSEAYNRMEELLEAFGEQVELIISNNDAMALGAISRMRQEGYFADTNGDGAIDAADERWIPVVGIDGLDEAVRQIEDGYLYGTVKNDSLRMAEAIVDLAEALLTGTDPAELTFPPEDGTYIWIDYQPFTLE
ncbi:MAG: galactose ABC transporter substrate-binding protein [Spirochaeta sp.]|jgi:methyl-galactoside transport system substrate-binding protein|nr:galactose ABC transporter substrate-binding protein [Spirochaeta sp.]